MKFDSYTVIARIFPGLLSSIPFFVLHFFYLRPALGQFWNEVLGIQIASDVTISLAFLFLLTQLSRFVSKELFEKKFFSNGLSLPTTEYLMHLYEHYSREYTAKIHEKIKADFDIEIPNSKQESLDIKSSRQIIMEVVSRIRTKVGKGNLLNQHNSEYGFVRNLSGGAIVALVMSIIDMYLFKILHPDPTAYLLSLVLFCIYLLVTIFSKKLITVFGSNYGEVLIQEYMSNLLDTKAY